jgi:hypothetical protein
LRGDAAFAKPEIYEYCEEQRLTYFIRLPANDNSDKLMAPHLNRPEGRPPKNGIQVKVVDLQYKAKSWHKPRRVVAKIEWHRGGLCPRIGFVVTNSRLPGGKVTKVYNGRGDEENRIKEGKNTLPWEKTSFQRFEGNQARLKMGVLAYNLLHMMRQFYVWGEEVKRSMDWLIKRLIRVGARFLITPEDGMSMWPRPFPWRTTTMPSLKGSGLKNRNFRGFFPSEKVPKNILGRRWPRLPHNLRLEELLVDYVQ